jgi:hypothetical protein
MPLPTSVNVQSFFNGELPHFFVSYRNFITAPVVVLETVNASSRACKHTQTVVLRSRTYFHGHMMLKWAICIYHILTELIPTSLQWIRKGHPSKITDTADEASVGGRTKIDSVQNVITMRSDLHDAWDNYEFGVDPNVGSILGYTLPLETHSPHRTITVSLHLLTAMRISMASVYNWIIFKIQHFVLSTCCSLITLCKVFPSI